MFCYETGQQAPTTGEQLRLPLRVAEDDGAGFMAWAFDTVKTYLEERKEATFVEIMRDKGRRLGLLLTA